MGKNIYLKNKILAALFLLLSICFLGNATTVKAADNKKVVYYASGKEVKTVTIEKGKSIKTIVPPAKDGYTAVGWDTASKANTIVYNTSKSVKVTKSMKLYAVYRKNCTVSYYWIQNGKTTKYKRVDTIRQYGTITLPSVSKKSGYIKTKWYSVKNGKKTYYSEKSKLKITGDMKLYIAYNPEVTLQFYDQDGKLYKKIPLSKNTYYELIALPNTLDKTFMGWNLSKKAKFPCKVYEPGTKLKISKTIKLYPVYFQRSIEKNITAETLTSLSKYKNLIIIGDSRTYHQEIVLQEANIDYKKAGISYVCKSGGTLAWFKEEGYSQLLAEIGQKSGKTAVVFNLGVNDMNMKNGADTYIQCLKGIAPELKKRGVALYFMSVNPINSAQIDAYIDTGAGLMRRKESKLRSFNETIKNGVSEYYTYIDCFTELMKTGYTTSKYPSTTIDDGLHYGERTYKRILDFVIKSVNK